MRRDQYANRGGQYVEMGLLTILKLLVDEVDDGARGDGPLSPKVETPEESR